MKPESEIQKAHDCLSSVIDLQDKGEIGEVISKETMPMLRSALDALSWVLDHDHNPEFGNNLRNIIREMSLRGFQMEREEGKE